VAAPTRCRIGGAADEEADRPQDQRGDQDVLEQVRGEAESAKQDEQEQQDDQRNH